MIILLSIFDPRVNNKNNYKEQTPKTFDFINTGSGKRRIKKYYTQIK